MIGFCEIGVLVVLHLFDKIFNYVFVFFVFGALLAGGAGVFGALSYAGFTSAGVTPRNTVLIMNIIPFTLGVR